jgi:4-amino-4-deoxy-L-arabinose transferase-like glycosyltransferase
MPDFDSTAASPAPIARAHGVCSWADAWSALGLFVLITLMVRLPFFFPAVLDWDESTYILMGQSLLDGHLPYVQLWDLKPPLAFGFYSLAIAVLGSDVVGIRVAGAICVVAIAFLVYLITTRLASRRTALLAAALCIPAVSLISSGQATMTEHVALVPLMGAVYLLARGAESVGALFSIGVLVAIAGLVRLNLAYDAVAIGAYVALRYFRYPLLGLTRAAAYAAGGVSMVLLTWLPYALTGQPDVWWSSVVTAAIKYSDSQYSLLGSAVAETLHAVGVYREGNGYKFEIHWFNVFVWASALAGMATVLRRWGEVAAAERRVYVIAAVIMFATAIGILRSGAAHEHYMIQLMPFATILAAVFLTSLPGRARQVSVALAALALLASMAPVFAEYKTMTARALAHEDLRYGPAYQIASYLRRENASNRPVYLLTDHIAYWFTHSLPPTRLVHPSTIGRQYLLEIALGKGMSAEDEIRKIFRQAPEFVVVTDDPWFLQGSSKTLFHDWLGEHYVLATEIEGRKIYRIKPSTDPRLLGRSGSKTP